MCQYTIFSNGIESFVVARGLRHKTTAQWSNTIHNLNVTLFQRFSMISIYRGLALSKTIDDF